MGAQVIGVARGTEKWKLLKEGADFVLDSEDPNLISRLKDLGGIDVVYDAVRGESIQISFQIM